jgi:hypothetical protein
MKNTDDINHVIREFLKQNAKKGGEAIKEQRGKSYFSDLAKKRWAAKKATQ